MPFDGVLSNLIAQELDKELAGARIDKIHMPEKDEILIALRNQKGNCKLLISANSNSPRIHLTTQKKDNPNSPPMFCMLLRKYMVGGRILSIKSYGFDRVVIIEFESSNELGDKSIKKLNVEIMGKHSNIILLNSDDKIIDCMYHVDSSISSKREVMPARSYEWPPSQDKVSPAQFDSHKALEFFRIAEGKTDKVILDMVQGFSPILSKEVCYRANLTNREMIESLADTQLLILLTELKKMVEEILKPELYPAVYSNDYHCIRLLHMNEPVLMDSINNALDYFYNKKLFDDKLKQAQSSLLKIVSNNQDRCVKKLSLQEKSISEAKDFDENRKTGELLTSNIHQIAAGQKLIEVSDFYSEDNKTIVIPLDENLSPQKNAQKYFKIYSKQKKTFEQASAQANETRMELEYLGSIELSIEQARTVEEVGEIKQELTSQGYISTSKRKGAKAEEIYSGPNEYLSTDGFTIYSGKNNRQNDLLTIKSSKPDDFWFHTQKIPGSHVIIKTSGKQVPDRTLEEAAMISAFNSRARNSAKVPVDYTSVRNVKKPPGSKPGMVIYDKFKTIIVTPEEAFIRKLEVGRK